MEVSAETREKMRQSRLGKSHSDETKQKLRESARRQMTPAAREHLSRLNQGKPSPMKGLKMSEEARTKMSAAKVGKPTWSKGRKMSLEARAKMSAARRGRRPWNKGVPQNPSYRRNVTRAAQAFLKGRRSKLELEVEAFFRAQSVKGLEVQFSHRRMPYCVWDFAIPSRKLLIEVDGCYWHGCKACGTQPKFGVGKNDKRKNKLATGAGWVLVRLSECAIKAGRYDAVLNLAKVGG